MTSRTRPPRPNDLPPRDPTQPLSIEVDPDDRDSHPSLAVGTHGDERTKVESPSARNNPVSVRERPASRPPPTPTRDEAERSLGQVLGTYRLVELLGKGGMGYVYRAEHTKLGREVALKVLRADYARRRDAVNRFFQEAKTVNRVRHRNIVDVTDFVELPDGTTFIIMELLRGQSLGKWARTGVDLPRALAVLVQICDGLGAAHAVGVVHRDLKPDNIVVVPTADGAELVKLLDFGVAKLVNRDDEDVGFQTQAGSVIGTPAYMSPEQAGGMVVDQRSDIYSLGAIMYELFCGQPLFRGRSFGEYVRKHLTEMPIAPKQTQGGAAMSDALEALIMRCLAKEPNDRFGHILELRDGLLHLLGGVETHPGVQQAISAIVPPPSGLRPPPTAQLSMSGQLPPHMLPLQPPAMHVPTPQPSHHSSHHSGLQSQQHPSQLSQLGYSQYSQPVPKTPLWVWLVGGSLAVGLGIVAAVWYANRGDEPKPTTQLALDPQPQKPKPGPDVTPVPEQKPQKPAPISLHFDSLPSGGVYADGHSAELCRTPCSLDVDPGDGESATQRTFVVRSEGYRDKSIVVDLTAPQREFNTTLERVEVAADPVETNVPDKRGTKPKLKPKTGTKSKTDKTDKTDKTADKTPEPDPVPEPPKPRPDDNLEKPDPHKKDTNIDPTDTHDPFHKK